MEYSKASPHCQPTLRAKVDEALARLQRLIWPSTCILCRGSGQRGLDLCAGCEGDLPRIPSACRRCGAPLGANPDGEAVCGGCIRRAPFFQATHAPYQYAYPIDRVIQALKYGRRCACGRVLGVLLAQSLAHRARASLPNVVIPIPLSAKRYSERGFNQAYELARPLRAALDVAIRADLVVRLRDTQEQAGLKRRERRRNVRGAFALVKPLPTAHVAILDDVITTGSTASEVAKVLRRAGARQVEVWAIARTSD